MPDSNPLRSPGDGGVGYCYDSDRDLFRGSGALSDGPMLLGLDSNIIFDLEDYGLLLIDGEDPDGVDCETQIELDGLRDLLELWFMRDIRFVVLPPTRTDFKREPPEARMLEREKLFGRIEEALIFQLQDWGADHARFAWTRPPHAQAADVIAQVPSELDRAMVHSAWSGGIDVFVTRDRQLLDTLAETPVGFPNVWSPSTLTQRLGQLPGYLFPGTLDHDGCIWSGGMPFGDTGKWSTLIEAFS